MTAAAIFANSAPLGGVSEFFRVRLMTSAAAEEVYEPRQTADKYAASNGVVNFDQMIKFVDYCYYYSTDDTFASAHKNDFLEIALTAEQENRTLPPSFMGLGNPSEPFNGKVQFLTQGYFPLYADRAFFSYVTDNAKLIGSDSNPITLQFARNSDVAEGMSAPLLADHIVHAEGGAAV